MNPTTIRINCPPAGISRNMRLEKLFTDIKNWIYSEPLRKLMELYDADIPAHLPLKEYIIQLNQFADIWDFRKRQANGGERWNVSNDDTAEKSKDVIMNCASQLGLVDCAHPLEAPDFILPLGGARLANLERAKCAREMGDLFRDFPFSIVALSGKRPINEVELPYISEYAPNALNEFDAINKGLEKAFDLSQDEYCETDYITKNLNLQWSRRKYSEKYFGHEIYSLAAPSSDPSRRANSLDTFEYFMRIFDVRPGQRLLLVTSCIYVPFQLLKFIPISIEKNIVVDCVGVSAKQKGTQFSKASNYLQEIKAAVNAIYHLAELYL